LHQVGTSSLLIYMMHGHTYIKYDLEGLAERKISCPVGNGTHIHLLSGPYPNHVSTYTD